MAKRSESGDTNRSELIRKYSAEHPDEGPKAIAEGLKQLGHNISPEYVSTVRSLDKKRRKGKPAAGATSRGRSAAASRPSGDQVSLQALLQVKRIADEMGGIEQARRALDALEQLSQ